jgi:hypothetical protein
MNKRKLDDPCGRVYVVTRLRATRPGAVHAWRAIARHDDPADGLAALLRYENSVTIEYGLVAASALSPHDIARFDTEITGRRVAEPPPQNARRRNAPLRRTFPLRILGLAILAGLVLLSFMLP